MKRKGDGTGVVVEHEEVNEEPKDDDEDPDEDEESEDEEEVEEGEERCNTSVNGILPIQGRESFSFSFIQVDSKEEG